MTVTVGYQTWNSASFNWDTAAAGSPVAEVCGALSTWITAINGNASQSGKQLALVRDHTSSTTANYRGWVVEAPLLESATRKLYWQLHSTSTTLLVARAFDDTFWSDTTSNGGYGGTSSSTSLAAYFLADGKTHKQTVTTYGDITVAYGTTNGEEFFCYSNYLDGDTTNLNDAFVLAKDIFGNWCAYTADATARVGAYYDPYIDRVVVANTISTGITSDGGSATMYVNGKILMYTPNPTITTGETRRQATAFATPALSLNPISPTVYGYANLGGGEYALQLTANGPYVRYTAV